MVQGHNAEGKQRISLRKVDGLNGLKYRRLQYRMKGGKSQSASYEDQELLSYSKERLVLR